MTIIKGRLRSSRKAAFDNPSNSDMFHKISIVPNHDMTACNVSAVKDSIIFITFVFMVTLRLFYHEVSLLTL